MCSQCSHTIVRLIYCSGAVLVVPLGSAHPPPCAGGGGGFDDPTNDCGGGSGTQCGCPLMCSNSTLSRPAPFWCHSHRCCPLTHVRRLPCPSTRLSAHPMQHPRGPAVACGVGAVLRTQPRCTFDCSHDRPLSKVQEASMSDGFGARRLLAIDQQCSSPSRITLAF